MKCKTACYVSECDTCRKVKADYLKPGGLLQPMSIPNWKWDDISMDFIMGLPLTAHFKPINTTYKIQNYAEIYITHVLCLHGVPKMIISDQGLHASLRTHLIHSSAYHP
jgi:hypothetical protein